MRRIPAALPIALGALGLLVTGPAAAAAALDGPTIASPGTDDAVDIAVTPGGGEWWVAHRDAQVSTAPLGEAQVTCPPPDERRGHVQAIDRTPSGEGYWLATDQGQVITCGDAGHFGDLTTLGVAPNGSVVGITATGTGQGYWLAADDGGVFSFGDARFAGSAGDIALNRPVVGIESAGGVDGYWLVADDGGVFAYGDATFHGSAGDVALNEPIVDMTRDGDGGGYYLLATDGGVFTYGDATFHGSRWTEPDPQQHSARFVGIDFSWTGDGYLTTDERSIVSTFGQIGGDDAGGTEVVATSDGFPGSGPPALLRDVDLAGHDTYDRFVFEFGDQLPEYRVRFIPPPVLQRPSSQPVDVAGMVFLEITAAAASGVDLSGPTPVETYTGPERLDAPGTEAVHEAVQVEDFESHLSWVLGLDEERDVEVFTLDDPARLVVDVSHTGETGS